MQEVNIHIHTVGRRYSEGEIMEGNIQGMILKGENIWDGRNGRVCIWQEIQESVYQEDIRERGIC